MKKKLTVIVREIVGDGNIRFSRVYRFPCEESARKFFHSEIGAFLYDIDDIEDIFKIDSEDKNQLTIFCRGFYRMFILSY